MSPSAFHRDHYGETYLHVPRAVAGTTLLALDELDEVLAEPGVFDRLEVSTLQADMAPTTRIADVTDVPAVTGDGVPGTGFIVVGLDRVLPVSHPLITSFRALEDALRMPARGLTVFATPPGAELPAHHDVYEVFTLQLDGAKRWQLFGQVPPHTPNGEYEIDSPEVDVTLAPGDLLYMPKAEVHRVAPVDGMSLSVALGFEPPSWYTMLEALYDELRDDQRFWRSIGPDQIAEGLDARKPALIDAVERLVGAAFERRIDADFTATITGLGSEAGTD